MVDALPRGGSEDARGGSSPPFRNALQKSFIPRSEAEYLRNRGIRAFGFSEESA